MASCAYCGSTLLWVKKRVGDLQFCNDECVQKGQLVLRARQIPETQALEFAMRLHNGNCPSCQGPGPVDVHFSHIVWSALVVTSWKSTPKVSCRSCGLKAQSLALGSSLLLGWWGFPWGILVTPIQVVRNIASMARFSATSGPSPKLVHMARLQLAATASPLQSA